MPTPLSNPRRLRALQPEVAKARSSLDSSHQTAPLPSRPSAAAAAGSSRNKNVFRISSILSSIRFRYTSLRSRYASLPVSLRRSVYVFRYLAALVPITAFFTNHVMQVLWVRGASMAPYLNEDYERTNTDSNMVLVSMWPWAAWPAPLSWTTSPEGQRKFERGMVVTFRSPVNPSNIAVKRIIALPGDRIFTRSPYAKESQIVPFNHVWVEGDAEDPSKTLDSNTYGPVSMNLVTGRVLAVLRPRFRWLNWTDWEDGLFDNGDPDRKPMLGYRKSVRDRVVKEAVNLEKPFFG